MLEKENVSYAELSRENYISIMRQGTVLEPEALMELAQKRDFASLGPAVVMRLRQQAKTACQVLLQMEQEAMAFPVLKVLRGQAEAIKYSGKNVWQGFEGVTF